MMYPKTFNKYLSAKRMAGVLLLIFSCLLIVGCSQTGTAEDKESSETDETVDKNAEAIQAVIEKEFNGPDQKYRELWDAAMATQKADMNQEEYDASMEEPAYKEFTKYMEDTYASYFTENAYDTFIRTEAFRYSFFDGDYKLNTSNIEINQSENGPTLYNFTFQVEYENGNKEASRYNFEGKAIVPEEGKIGKIEFHDKDGLQEKVNEDDFN